MRVIGQLCIARLSNERRVCMSVCLSQTRITARQTNEGSLGKWQYCILLSYVMPMRNLLVIVKCLFWCYSRGHRERLFVSEQNTNIAKHSTEADSTAGGHRGNNLGVVLSLPVRCVYNWTVWRVLGSNLHKTAGAHIREIFPGGPLLRKTIRSHAFSVRLTRSVAVSLTLTQLATWNHAFRGTWNSINSNIISGVGMGVCRLC